MSKRVPKDLDTNFDFRFGDKLKKSGEIIVAHSTSSNLLPEILKHGLKRDSESVWENTSSGKLFFEVEPTRTHYGENVYGWKSVQKHGGVPVTLYVKVKQNKLRTDMDDADLGLKYQKNQKECTCDVPAEDVLGLNFVGSIDIAPKDFMEFYEMFSDDKMNNGGNFEKSVFIHSAEKNDRESIIKNGLHASKNPVIINGIFTFPEQWGHHKSAFDKKNYDYYEIRLKDGAEIFWTDSDRPMDAVFGSGNVEYRQVYDKLVANTSAKNREGVMQFITGFQSGKGENWFNWKTEFSREMEKYLDENNYAGIQEGGQIVITDLNSIESVTLNGKKINIDFGDNKKTKKMKNDNLYAEGGNLEGVSVGSKEKPEEIISDEVNFDTRKGLNRSDKVVPKEVIEEIEEKGMSLERLESLGLPIFKYHTQITVHGVFEGIGSGRVGGYKNLLSNQNQTLGVKYNAIDLEKKKIISKSLRLDREFNYATKEAVDKLVREKGIKEGEAVNEVHGLGFSSRMDSRGFELYKNKIVTTKEEYIKAIEEFKEEIKKIPSNFIGKKIIHAYKTWGGVVVEILIDFKAIKQENLWSFISSLTDGRISNEEAFTDLLMKEKVKEQEREAINKKQREEYNKKQQEQLNIIKEKSPFSKSNSLPTSDEFIVATIGNNFRGAISVYIVFKNKTGRKVYALNNYSDWSNVPTSITDEIKNNRGNKLYDDMTIRLLTKRIENNNLYDIYEKKTEVKKPIPSSIYSDTKTTETVSGDDSVLLDDTRYQLVKSKHTKTGDTIYLFKLKQRVEREDYKKIEANVKSIRGYYSSFVTAFVLKSAISANEAEMLLKGSSLEHGKNEDGGKISNDPKINEAANNEVEKLVEETNITKDEAVKEMKEGVKVEEEHRETLEKLNDGKITVEEALAETASVHIEEKKDYYTEGLIPMENKDKSVDELKKQLGEAELQLFNKASERVGNVDLARTIELAENIAKLENQERKDSLAFFAEALQYTVSNVEKNEDYARFWADDLLYMVNRSNSGFIQLERAIEVGAIEGGESFLEHIKAFKMAAETFRSLNNEGHKALIANFVDRFIVGNELSTQQDYIWMAINDVYKLIYFAKGNETDTTKIAEYIGELMTKYQSQTELEKLVDQSVESIKKQTEDEGGGIEYTEGKYEDGRDVFGANIRYKNELVIIPLGRYETKEEVETRANKILQELRFDVFGDELQELTRRDAADEQTELGKIKNQYPIVLEISEGLTEQNIGVDYLHQLESLIVKAGFSNNPNEIYIKNKVWFRDYPADGLYQQFRIDSSYKEGDYNHDKFHLIDYLRKHEPNFDWTIYEYGDNYKFGHQPEPEFKAGDLVRISPDVNNLEFGSGKRVEFNYGFVKSPTIFNRDESRWKKQWEYVITDFFDKEKLYSDIREFRLSLTTEDEIISDMLQRKIDEGKAEPLNKEEAEILADKYIGEINRLHEEYTKSGEGNYWKEQFENQIYTQFYDWFSEVVSRYPLMLGQWMNMQVEKLNMQIKKHPAYKDHLLKGFIDVDFALTNLLQFINSLNKYNVGKTKPFGIYELIPENFIYKGKLPKVLDFEVDPSSSELVNIMKPFMMKDDLRPSMSSINFDKYGATATDAHRLMFLKTKSDKIGIYGYGKIAEESGQYTKRGKYLVGKKDMKYPQYQKVIPNKYENVITLNREQVEQLLIVLNTFKNTSYVNKITGMCYFSFNKGQVSHFNLFYAIDLFEAWLKIGFEKLEVTNSTLSSYKHVSKRNILLVSPDLSKFTNNLKGSGSILMGLMIEGGADVRDIVRGEMYIDVASCTAKTAGVNDDLFTEYNVSYNTYGAETESDEIKGIEDMIEIYNEMLSENPDNIEAKEGLEMYQEMLVELKEKNKNKFDCGGKMYYNGGKLPMAMPYNDGGNLFGDEILSNIEKVNKINNTPFYRYYPVGVNPFEVSFDSTNSYGYGIYFLDNPYYYKNKFTNGRLLTIRPRLQNPLVFMSNDNRTPNSEYAEAYMNAVKNDNLENKDAFTRKMVDAGYDSLVAVEPRGTYLVLFSNDPDLYEIESDLSSDAIDEKVKNELSEMISSSINEAMSKNPELNETEANFLYNTFKHTVIDGQQKEIPVWISNDGFKGSMKKVLLKKKFIDDHWAVFNKPMSYDRNEYALTEKGKSFIKDIHDIYEIKISGGKKMSDGGNVDAIDNPRALGTALKKVFKSDYNIEIDTRYIKTVRGVDGSYYEVSTLSSGHIIPNQVRKELLELSYGKPISELGVSNPNDISYGNIRAERISVFGKHWKEWLKTKKFDDGGNIPENLTDEDVLKLAETAKSEINDALSKLYAERDFHGTAIKFGDKSKETKLKFDDVTSRILLIQNKEKSIDEIISKYKKAKGGLIIDENWGNDGSTPSNNKDYNDLYAMFPDNHKEAKRVWNQLSEKQKEGFLNDLDVTDAANEHIKDSWLEFVNAKSEKDWLENATNWDEMAKGGGVGKKYAIIYFKDKKPIKKRYDSAFKAFSDYESEGSVYAELFNENGVLSSTFPNKGIDNKYANGGGVDDYKFTYMMLGRLQTDNDYYLGHGNRSEKNLWAGSVDEQIKEMKKLWNKLPENKKPEWLSMEDILEYEKKMKEQYAKGGGVDNINTETWYISYLDKKNNFRQTDKTFTGKNAYDDAVEWGRKNLGNFNTDMVRRKFNDGGEINENEVKQKLINILSSLDESDLLDFFYHIGNVDVSYVDDIVAGYENWVNGLPKDELDMLLWRMKMPYFYEFSPKDNYSTPTPVPSKFATYNDFYEKKYAKGGSFSSLSELKKWEINNMAWSEMEVVFEPRGDNGLEGYDRNRTYYYKAYNTDSGTGTTKTRYLITNGYNSESGKVFGDVDDVSAIVFGKYFKKV